MNNNNMEQRVKELETLLQQFYNLKGDDPKRNEMDTFLTSYQSQKDSYEHAKYYLQHSSNEYLVWFSLSILENKVCKAWNTLTPQDQNDIKGCLFDLYLNNKTLPSYIIAKLGQVLADIGRNDFHQNPHEYILNVTALIRNNHTSLRGVNLLQYISVEFMTPKEVLTQQHKNQLRKLLLEQVPTIIEVLKQYLDQLYEQQTTTKPTTLVGSPYPVAVGSPDTTTIGNYSLETKNLTKAVFDSLLKYFSWIPLNEFLSPSLLDTLFKFLKRNNIVALECLNEILSKNCVPREFEEFLVRVFKQIQGMLVEITSNNITQYAPDFIDKFTQFISLFVTNHLRRVEGNQKFEITSFLSQLFQYSFLQNTIESFEHCMDIWTTFLDYLLNQVNERSIQAPVQYTDGLIRLQSELVKRILFSYNRDMLSQLDDDDETDDSELEPVKSQLKSFVSDSIEIITKITELYPAKGLENLYPLFSQNVSSFFAKVDEMIKQGFSMAEQQQTELINSVKDVTTILHLFERLTHLFVASFVNHFTAANFILQKLIEMCSFAESNYIYKFGSEWESLQIQLLNTIKSYCYWLGEYGNQVRVAPAQQTDFDQTTLKIINIIVPLFNSGVPENVSITSGRLLMGIVVISKPLNLFSQMEAVIANIHTICTQLPPAVQSIIYSTISATILTPPSNVNLGHQWDQRRPKYSPFIKGITAQYLEIPQIQGFIDNKLYTKDEVIQRVQRVLKTLTLIIKSVPDVSTAKGILHDTIQDTLPVTLGLFRIYINTPDILESILDFFFALFESLKTQVGVAFTQQTITTFLEILGGDNIKQLLSGKSEVGNVIIKKLIEILTFVIQTYGHSFETLLTSIISFSMEKIYPSIINTTSPLKPLFFTLLCTILDHHWKHFFPSTLGSSVNGGNGTTANPVAGQQLNSILMAFQTSFQQNDVNLFKQNLDFFEKLNNKHKLYEKIAQQESIFGCTFIGIFFDVLISKVQSVQAEEIINTIYHFASINFSKFFNEFFNTYLIQKPITNEQKATIKTNFTEDKDHPTFNRNMNQFINDFSYYTYING